MKFKTLTSLLALTMVLTLTACGGSSGGNGSNNNTDAGSANVDLTAFVNDLASKHGENFAADADVVEAGMVNDFYPGLGDISTKQLIALQPNMSAVVCEIVLVEVTDAADVNAVKDILQARIDAQVNGGAWYPASIEGWEKNSRIAVNGNYVMMIAWEFCDDAVNSFNALFA